MDHRGVRRCVVEPGRQRLRLRRLGRRDDSHRHAGPRPAARLRGGVRAPAVRRPGARGRLRPDAIDQVQRRLRRLRQRHRGRTAEHGGIAASVHRDGHRRARRGNRRGHRPHREHRAARRRNERAGDPGAQRGGQRRRSLVDPRARRGRRSASACIPGVTGQRRAGRGDASECVRQRERSQWRRADRDVQRAAARSPGGRGLQHHRAPRHAVLRGEPRRHLQRPDELDREQPVRRQHRVRDRARRLRQRRERGSSMDHGRGGVRALGGFRNDRIGRRDPVRHRGGESRPDPERHRATRHERERHDGPAQPDLRPGSLLPGEPVLPRLLRRELHVRRRLPEQHGQPLRVVQRERDGLRRLPSRVRPSEQPDAASGPGVDGQHPHECLSDAARDRERALSARPRAGRSPTRARPSTTRSRTTRTRS